MNGSGSLLCEVIATTPVCSSASRRPSRCAPSATRCSVGARPPTTRYTPSRDSMMRTGRCASFAAAAARIWCCHSVLPPKPPPTKGEVTCTCSSFRPNTCASDHATCCTPCDAVVHHEVVAVPAQRGRVQLDRVVVVARRGVGDVDLDGRRPQTPGRASPTSCCRACPGRRRRACASSPRRTPSTPARGRSARGSATSRGRPAPASRPARSRSAGRSTRCGRPASPAGCRPTRPWRPT